MVGFQLFKLNYLKVFSNKMAEFIELFFIIVDCKFREFTNLTIKQKLMNQFV